MTAAPVDRVAAAGPVDSGCQLLPFADQPGVCDGCGTKLTGRRTRWCSGECADEWVRQHNWAWARAAAKRRDSHRCVTCGQTRRLEVNHIEPRVGQGYGWGCWNHLDNLETLCHWCHLAVTKQQVAERRVPPQCETLPLEVSS